METEHEEELAKAVLERYTWKKCVPLKGIHRVKESELKGACFHGAAIHSIALYSTLRCLCLCCPFVVLRLALFLLRSCCLRKLDC